jgi:hypothetical protein
MPFYRGIIFFEFYSLKLSIYTGQLLKLFSLKFQVYIKKTWPAFARIGGKFIIKSLYFTLAFNKYLAALLSGGEDPHFLNILLCFLFDKMLSFESFSSSSTVGKRKKSPGFF